MSTHAKPISRDILVSIVGPLGGANKAAPGPTTPTVLPCSTRSRTTYARISRKSNLSAEVHRSPVLTQSLFLKTSTPHRQPFDTRKTQMNGDTYESISVQYFWTDQARTDSANMDKYLSWSERVDRRPRPPDLGCEGPQINLLPAFPSLQTAPQTEQADRHACAAATSRVCCSHLTLTLQLLFASGPFWA